MPTRCVGLVLLALIWPVAVRAEFGDRFPRTMKVEVQDDRLVIWRDVMPVATYVFRDREILRPYFAHVHVGSGAPSTRHHPPREGVDPVDHATMHPGIWLAFGDINGNDFWRNKGRVQHVEFVERPAATIDGKDGVVSFVVKNRYVAGERTICEEVARHTVRAAHDGYLLTFDSEFSGKDLLVFGDQEEMGLGIRLATPLAVKGGSGTIASSDGGTNESQVWGRQADWCDYSGIITEQIRPAVGVSERKLRVGLLLVPHSGNFRRSWMHARDYGLVVANPFGQQAFTKGPQSRVEVKPGQSLRLRFGVWSYAANIGEKVDLAKLAQEYQRQAEDAK